MTLKCVSDPRGTLWEADSLSTSKCFGENTAWSFEMILPSTGRLSASASASAMLLVRRPLSRGTVAKFGRSSGSKKMPLGITYA